MFDFGSKKEIELLKYKIAELTFENLEKNKTVDSLIGEINKLTNKVKELEEKLKVAELGLDCDCDFFCVLREDENKNEVKIYDTLYTRYTELYSKFTKNNSKVDDDFFTYFKFGDTNEQGYKFTGMNYIDNSLNVMTNEFLISNEKSNHVYTYHGIPFRRLDDLYKIMEFIENIKHIEFFDKHKAMFEEQEIITYKECDFQDIKKYIRIKLLENNNIKINIVNLDVKEGMKKINEKYNSHKLYLKRQLPTFAYKYFETEKELKRIIKKELYTKYFGSLNWFKEQIKYRL